MNVMPLNNRLQRTALRRRRAQTLGGFEYRFFYWVLSIILSCANSIAG
jgi:hypothetical protein